MCVVGIAVGQLLVGPLSDTLGRRRPLIAGLILYIASSLGCAAAPSIAVLDGLRLLQGISGATGIVIARAMVRDMYSGVEAARLYATLGAIIPLAPILAPTVGGAILLVTSWRGIFAAQATVGAVLLAAAVLITHETLAPAARHVGLGARRARDLSRPPPQPALQPRRRGRLAWVRRLLCLHLRVVVRVPGRARLQRTGIRSAVCRQRDRPARHQRRERKARRARLRPSDCCAPAWARSPVQVC